MSSWVTMIVLAARTHHGILCTPARAAPSLNWSPPAARACCTASRPHRTEPQTVGAVYDRAYNLTKFQSRHRVVFEHENLRLTAAKVLPDNNRTSVIHRPTRTTRLIRRQRCAHRLPGLT